MQNKNVFESVFNFALIKKNNGTLIYYKYLAYEKKYLHSLCTFRGKI